MKMKHEEDSLKSLIEKLEKDLGLTEALSQEVLDAMGKKFASKGKEAGEPTEEVLETCLAQMAKLKEVKWKKVLVSIMLGHLPLTDQVDVIEVQKKLAGGTFLEKCTQNGLGGLLTAIIMANKDE